MKFKATVFLFLSFTVAAMAIQNEPPNITITDLPRTPPEVHERLYEQIALIHRVCTANNIKYWLIGGSLLGQVRGELLTGRGEIIQWDDDADVGIEVSDKERLMKLLREEAQKVEMTVWNTEHGLKLKCLKRLAVGTDIFVYQREETKWVLAMDASRKAWPKDYFLSEELETLNPVRFGAIQAMIPTNPLRYLSTLYGPNCMKIAVLSFSHLENRPHNLSGVKVPLSNNSNPE